MLGDFQYYSSSSEESNSECDSDFSTKSADDVEKLISEKNSLEEKIKPYQSKLKYIQKTLRSLNEERKTLLTLRNKLISSSCFEHVDDLAGNAASTNNNAQMQSDIFGNTSAMSEFNSQKRNADVKPSVFEPLNLNVPSFSKSDDVEEFDSEDDQ